MVEAAALNYALAQIEEEIYVGIDADTVIAAADAISKLIPHFEDPNIGAVAGNAKVGNRVNLWDALAGPGIHHQPELRSGAPSICSMWSPWFQGQLAPGAQRL